jgi:hypothetical protein
MTADERARFDAGRQDWQENRWQDHCGVVGCEQCGLAWIPEGDPRFVRA